MYTNTGILRADSTFKISANQFQVWRRVEGNVCTLISSNLVYPTLAERNGLEGKVIFAFEYKKGNIIDIRIAREGYELFNQASLESLQRATPYISKEFKYWQSKLREKADGTYYVPIDFSLIPYEKALKEKQAIPSIKLSPGTFGGYGH